MSSSSSLSVCFKPVAAGLLLALATLLPSSASADDLAVGLKVGGNWSILSKPTDPRGEPTLLSGSAFDGSGLVLGASLHYPLVDLEGARLEFEGGLLFSNHSTEGFEENADTGERRTITLGANILHVPLMVHLRRGDTGTGFRVGAGLQPMIGMQSSALVDPGPEKLFTTPTFHLGATVALGFDWQANNTFVVPFEFRATWDPAVASSTKERFENFRSAENPGDYQVAYDWQLLFMTGFRYEL